MRLRRLLPGLLLLTIIGCGAAAKEQDEAPPEIDVVTNTVETREESTQATTSDGGTKKPLRMWMYYDQSLPSW
jgi:hypothetical protein